MSWSRVFFDTNRGTMEHGYWLGFDRSKADLAAIGDVLGDGTLVTLYMPDELELDATLRFDPEEGVWRAYPIAGTVKYVDGVYRPLPTHSGS